MKKYLVLLLAVAAIITMVMYKKQKPFNNKKTVATTITVPAAKKLNYDSCLAQLQQQKIALKKTWPTTPAAQQAQFFCQSIVNTIIPSWLGTKWDFNGTTQKPQQGAIACGYFVTTVLQHAGVKLNRVRLAQATSATLITTLVSPQHVVKTSNQSLPNFCKMVQQAGYGLYILGLDNHVGFIYNNGANIYFIHSTYIGSGTVVQELACQSSIIANSGYKVLGAISKQTNILNAFVQ
jgi:hypothetical protein